MTSISTSTSNDSSNIDINSTDNSSNEYISFRQGQEASDVITDEETNSPNKDTNMSSQRKSEFYTVPRIRMFVLFVSKCIQSINSTRMLVLIVLSLQNSLFTVLRRYSQGVLKESYSTYEVLLVGEIIKVVFSGYMIRSGVVTDQQQQQQLRRTQLQDSNIGSTTDDRISINTDPTSGNGNANTGMGGNNNFTMTKKSLNDAWTDRLKFVVLNSQKMFGLALIYGIMNILSFVSLRNIGAGMFTIFAQCKIMTTATFSTLLLKRRYSYTKWRALAALMAGVLLFSEPIWSSNDAFFRSKNESANAFIGVMAVLIEVTLSGFASIYFEKVIKLDPLQLSIWERNFQLALWSFPVYLGFIAFEHGGESGIFGGWSVMAVIVASLGAAGGILVALSIKYGDAILKTLATTAAIVLSSWLDYMFLGGPLSPTMCIAAFQVIIAIANYSFDATPNDSDSTTSNSNNRSSNDDSHLQSGTPSKPSHVMGNTTFTTAKKPAGINQSKDFGTDTEKVDDESIPLMSTKPNSLTK